MKILKQKGVWYAVFSGEGQRLPLANVGFQASLEAHLDAIEARYTLSGTGNLVQAEITAARTAVRGNNLAGTASAMDAVMAKLA